MNHAMANEEAKALGEFGASFREFLDQMAVQAPAEDPIFLTLLRNHFSAQPATFPIVGGQLRP
jgi:hypothetical protein